MDLVAGLAGGRDDSQRHRCLARTAPAFIAGQLAAQGAGVGGLDGRVAGGALGLELGDLGLLLQQLQRPLPGLRKLAVPMVLMVTPPDEAQVPRFQAGLQALQPARMMSAWS